MMGRREDRQGQFLYEFNLDEVVPPDHLVRKIDAVLDLGWVHKELAPYYSHTGRPSIDPVLMIRMLIVGYVFAIRSERRICAEVQVNLAYRWYCRLSVEDKIPDHSVFSRARHERFRESDALRRVFERVVGLCIAAGLVGGEAFSIDASLIKADVDKKKRAPGDQPIEWPTPEEASHAVREYLAALDAARRDEESGGGDGGGSSNSGDGKPPKEISLTDPQAAWVARKGVDPFFAYDANYLIDNKFGIILDAERHARQSHRRDGHRRDYVGSCRAPLRSQARAARRRYRLRRGKASEVALGSGHHTARSGVGQVRDDQTASSAGPTSSSTRSAMSTSVLPGPNSRTRGSSIRGAFFRIGPARTIARSASSSPSARRRVARKVSRDIDEDVREQVRALANTEAFQLSCRERKKVEVRFAHMKRILKLDRLRLRGLSGARDEVLLTATAQNLRRLVKLICRGPPRAAMCAA